MVKGYLPRSCYNAFSNPRPLANSVAVSLMLCCPQPCQCVLSQPVANPNSRSITHKIDQHPRSADNGHDSALLRSDPLSLLRFLCEIELSLQSCTFCRPHLLKMLRASEPIIFGLTCWSAHRALAPVWCKFCRPHLLKVLRAFEPVILGLTCWSSNRALASVWCTFCRPPLPKVLRARYFCLTCWSANQTLASVWCTFCRPPLPKVLQARHFCLTCWNANRARASVWCTFCRPRLPKVLQARHFCLTCWSANQTLASVWCTFCRPPLPKVLQARHFCLTCWNANRALASVWCTFCWPPLPKVLQARHFCLACWNANRALASVWCTFGRPPLPKVLWARQFFAFLNMLKCKSSSRYSPVCTFCRQLLQVEHRTHGKDPIYYTLATTEATLPEKHRISCPRVLVCEFTRSRPATLPNYFMMGGWSWWCGWHDDVVDMMMWSTWWCGWHDGGNANHENRFLTKLPLIIYIYTNWLPWFLDKSTCLMLKSTISRPKHRFQIVSLILAISLPNNRNYQQKISAWMCRAVDSGTHSVSAFVSFWMCMAGNMICSPKIMVFLE